MSHVGMGSTKKQLKISALWRQLHKDERSLPTQLTETTRRQ